MHTEDKRLDEAIKNLREAVARASAAEERAARVRAKSGTHQPVEARS